MFKRIAALAAITVMVVGGVAGLASANTVHDTNWTQSSAGLRCATPIVGDPGGAVRLRVSGNETRRVGQGFATRYVDTWMDVEKWVNGKWRYFDSSADRIGFLGTVGPIGHGLEMGRINWTDSPVNPTAPYFSVTVGTSGQYRASISTVVFDQDGYDVAHLTTTVASTCTFVGKK